MNLTDTDYENNPAHVMGEGTRTTFAGREWDIKFAGINELVAMKKQFPDIVGFAFDTDNMEQLRFFLYLILRKSDPTLTPAQIKAREYNFTEEEIGDLLTLPVLSSPKMALVLNYVMTGSGLLETPDEKIARERRDAEDRAKNDLKATENP